MEVRKNYRKYRRSHKRYRPKRFHNRSSSKRKGRIPPTIRQKREAVVRVAKNLYKWVRIDKIFLEDVSIDIRSLTEGTKLYKWQYQKSNRLDENLRKATLLRDNFTCQMCSKKDCRLEAHHIHPRRFGGADSIYNLITLCQTCHQNITNKELEYKDFFHEKINGKQVYTKYAQHVMQGKKYLREELKNIAPVVLTTGGNTANKRIDWDIPKSHSNDAIVITDLEIQSTQCDIKDWLIKPMRKRSEAKKEGVADFRHRDMVRYTKRNGEIYEAYITALYPEKKQCNMTTTNGKVLKRYGIKSLTLIWRFQNIYWF